MMKYILCIFSALLAVSMVNSQMEFLEQLTECSNEMNVSLDQIPIMAASHDEKLGCLRACVLKKLGVMKNGSLDKDALLAVAEQTKGSSPHFDEMTKNIVTCYNDAINTGDSECQVAGQFMDCMEEKMHG